MTPRVKDATGMRYHGAQGRRGALDALLTVASDLTHAIDALTKARDRITLVDRERPERVLRAVLLGEAREQAELGLRFARVALRGRLPKKLAKGPTRQMKLEYGRTK